MGHSMDRRMLLRGALGGAAALGLAACGAPPLVVPEKAARGDAAPGLVMRIARPAASAAETLDPASSLSAYEYLGALYNRVVRLDRNGETVPDLATDWSSDSNATTWTFKLRSDVRFHDGKPLTSRDVRYTFRHILDPETGSPQAGPLELIESIDVPDTTTVRFALSTPNAEFPSLLTAYQCYVIPEDSAATIGRTGVGTGPFVLDSFDPAGSGMVVANPDYFDGPPRLEAIEFHSIQDSSARVNALLAGQVDLLAQTNLANPTARVVEGSPGTTIARVENAQWYAMPMLFTSEEFADSNVREAMRLTYDPARVLATAVQGVGSPGWDNPVPPQLAAFLDHQRDYDPEKAKHLLKKAGREDLRVRLHTSAYDPNFTPIATAYAQQAKAAGVQLDISNTSADSYYTQIWMQVPLMITYWATGRPIDQLLNQIFRTGSSYNESAWSNEKFDQLLDSARADTNDDTRLAKYQDAQRMIIEDGATLTPLFGDRLVGLSTNVVNYDEYGFEFDYLNIGLREAA